MAQSADQRGARRMPIWGWGRGRGEDLEINVSGKGTYVEVSFGEGPLLEDDLGLLCLKHGNLSGKCGST